MDWIAATFREKVEWSLKVQQAEHLKELIRHAKFELAELVEKSIEIRHKLEGWEKELAELGL